MFKKIFATMLAVMLVCIGGTVVVSAANYYNDYDYGYYDRYYSSSYYDSYGNYSDWFDLSRINAVDVRINLHYDATREEVAAIPALAMEEMDRQRSSFAKNNFFSKSEFYMQNTEKQLLPNSATQNFEDRQNFVSSQSYNLISRLTSTGIAKGYPGNVFLPDQSITRAEAVVMVMRTKEHLNLVPRETRRYNTRFNDIDNHWAKDYIEDAAEIGLVGGYNGYFRPDDEITREEVITMYLNLFGDSNNSLIHAVDTLYGLEFNNDVIDDRTSSRYEDDYEDRLDRPNVNTGNSSSSSNNSSYNNNSNRPERPTVNNTNNTNNNETTNGSKPERPNVEVPSSRPTVDEDNTVSSNRPGRPTI